MRFRTNWNRVERLRRTQQSVEFTSNVSALLCQRAGVHELSVGLYRNVAGPMGVIYAQSGVKGVKFRAMSSITY